MKLYVPEFAKSLVPAMPSPTASIADSVQLPITDGETFDYATRTGLRGRQIIKGAHRKAMKSDLGKELTGEELRGHGLRALSLYVVTDAVES